MIDFSGFNPTLFHFLRPWAFLALLPLGMLIVALARRHRSGGGWRAICDPALLPHVVGDGRQCHRWPLVTLALASLIAVTALAGPTWERLPQPVFRDLSSLVIALDLSASMNAADVSPNRLERARFKVTDILKRRREGQTGLVVYAGDAFTVSPLSNDTATIIAQLPAMQTELMPSPGSRADRAVQRAAELLRQAGQTAGDILLISDDLNAASRNALAPILAQFPYRISVLAVGTADGAPIPAPGGGFIKDNNGGIVVATLDTGPLCDLATRSGGICLNLRPDEQDVDALFTFLARQRNTRNLMDSDLQADQWREFGPWLLLLLLPLAVLIFRRGILVLALVFLLPLPDAHADWQWPQQWADWWQTPDQQASAEMDARNPAKAASRFTDPRWAASAHYQAKQFPEARKQLESLPEATADDRYNLGNALAREGRLDEAVRAYDQALKAQPDMADARYNRDLVQQLIERMRQQQPNPEPQSGKEGKTGEGAQSGGGDNPQQQGEQQDKQGQQGSEGDQNDPSRGEQGTPQDQKSAQRNQADEVRPEQQDAAVNPSPSAIEQNDPRAQAEAQRNDQGQRAEDGDHPNADQSADAERHPADESRQATEQWLRRIPDDPSGLWRRKFLYQYRDRANHPEPGSGQAPEVETW
ncbi:MAG: VWA domain-containing protein [Gammaproteobacteria bacterium]|nr:VWA domain-containing protein [Gammaproteobacteria bacterium]MCP5137781.1 VWA domain-containing protein [Gammaproteobacteria bacterium]